MMASRKGAGETRAIGRGLLPARRDLRGPRADWKPILVLGLLTLGLALAGSSRLNYHEAIEGQAAREMLQRGDWLVPTIGGRPWLEKPPLAYWCVAGLGGLAGRVDAWVARLPGMLAGLMTAIAVAVLAGRRFGREVGPLAGLVQVSSVWLVTRARLAEPDVPLACLIAWSMVALDRTRAGGAGWRWAFFGLLGSTALLKGVGFGGALIIAAVVIILVWDQDAPLLRALIWPTGWALAAGIALAWPLAVLGRHPEALGLWVHHVGDRFAASPSSFAGESWWQYAPSPLVGLLPWTPLALGGAWRSWKHAWAASGRFGPDRLLWAWTLGPAILVSLASVRNSHYLIHALPPASVWAALGLIRLGERLAGWGWSPRSVQRAAVAMFATVGLAWGLGYAGLGPWLDQRGKGAEWAFYERVGRTLGDGEPLVLLYDDLQRPERWDRWPYPTPFGPVPPDLAARLFHLDRPGVAWLFGFEALAGWVDGEEPKSFVVVARDRDRDELEKIGRVETVALGPNERWDRVFVVFRIRRLTEPGPGL